MTLLVPLVGIVVVYVGGDLGVGVTGLKLFVRVEEHPWKEKRRRTNEEIMMVVTNLAITIGVINVNVTVISIKY